MIKAKKPKSIVTSPIWKAKDASIWKFQAANVANFLGSVASSNPQRMVHRKSKARSRIRNDISGVEETSLWFTFLATAFAASSSMLTKLL